MSINNYLTTSQIKKFRKDGFLGPLPKFASDTDIKLLSDFFIHIEEKKPDNPMYGRFSVRDYHLQNNILKSLFSHPSLVGPLTQLMGDNLVLWRSKAFLKPAGGKELGWHQEWGTFNGAELGNDRPALEPQVDLDLPWNITVWFALEDIDETMGPIRFIRGSHKKHYPVAQVAMNKSAFFDSPFEGLSNVEEIVNQAKSNTLVLDIDTSRIFDDIDWELFSFEEAKSLVYNYLSKFTGEIALPFDIISNDLITMPMKKGEFVIFYERVMHGSGENTSKDSEFNKT